MRSLDSSLLLFALVFVKDAEVFTRMLLFVVDARTFLTAQLFAEASVSSRADAVVVVVVEAAAVAFLRDDHSE